MGICEGDDFICRAVHALKPFPGCAIICAGCVLVDIIANVYDGVQIIDMRHFAIGIVVAGRKVRTGRQSQIYGAGVIGW